MFLYIYRPINAPIKGANIYIIMLQKFNYKIAGPSDLAGFIDAPVNGPPTNEQTQT